MQRQDSLWLGPLGPPVKWAMIVSGAAAAAMALWLIAGQVWRADPVGMFEMLRPEGRPEVPLMLGSLAAAMLFAALHLSDRKGAIERPPTGPMDIVALVMSRLAMIGIVCVVAAMIYEVAARYVFEKPTLWANELSLWIAGFVFLLAGLYAMQQRSHIRIYVIYDLLPRPLQKAADVVSVGLIWGFFLCLLWGGYGEAVTKFARMETFGTAWDPPLPATIKPAILIVIGLVALQALSNLIADWNRPPEYHSALDDIDETEIANIRRTLED